MTLSHHAPPRIVAGRGTASPAAIDTSKSTREADVLERLADLTEAMSPLAACRVLFARYDDRGSASTPDGLSDELFDPCEGIHQPFVYRLPGEDGFRAVHCRRCGYRLGRWRR